MYLTKYELKDKSIPASETLHGMIENSFEEKGGHLWGIHGSSLYLVSDQIPDHSIICSQIAKTGTAKTVNYDPFLSEIHNGDRRMFSVIIEPVKRHNQKPLPYHTGDEIEWLRVRMERYGFVCDPSEIRCDPAKWIEFGKADGNRVKMITVRMTGMLTVTDEDAMRETLKCGMGRGKAYGCGLVLLSGKSSPRERA